MATPELEESPKFRSIPPCQLYESSGTIVELGGALSRWIETRGLTPIGDESVQPLPI
jgi:hypothetical protein